MPNLNTTPRKTLDAASERLVVASIAVAYIDSLPKDERAGYVKAKIRFSAAWKAYLTAREAYVAAYPHATVPQLIAAR